jgi:hypothetical protein
MNYFEENPEFNYFFTLYPDCIEFQNYFIQRRGSLPMLKDFETINSDPVFKKWTLEKKTEFWATVGSWYHFTRSIIIEDDFCKELSKAALSRSMLKEDLEEVTIPLEKLQTDQDRYGYVLRKLTDLESFWSREGYPVGSRGNDEHIIKYLKLEVQFYERMFTFLGLSAAKIKTEQQPKDKNKPTTSQIALFFYYLVISKDITPPPGRMFFKLDEKHKQPPYNFDASGQKVYWFFNILRGSKSKKVSVDDVMTIKNLKAVIPMLKKYPVAQGKAKNDLYSKGIAD